MVCFSDNEGNYCKYSKWKEFIDTAKTELHQTSDFNNLKSFHSIEMTAVYKDTSTLTDRLVEGKNNLKRAQEPFSSHDGNSTKINVSDTSTAHLNEFVVPENSVAIPSHSKRKNSDYNSDISYGAEKNNLPSNKTRKLNTTLSRLKSEEYCEQESSTNMNNILSQNKESSAKMYLQESRELNSLQNGYQSSFRKMLTSSIKMNIKDTDLACCELSSLPVFEQSGDPNDIDIQLDF